MSHNVSYASFLVSSITQAFIKLKSSSESEFKILLKTSEKNADFFMQFIPSVYISNIQQKSFIFLLQNNQKIKRKN